MGSNLLAAASRDVNHDGKKLQESLDQYNKDFFDVISFFPETYALHKKDVNNQKFKRIDASLNKNKADMYELYVLVNSHLKKNHERIQDQNVNIDLFKDKQTLLTNELEEYKSKDIASQQMKIDHVEHYRRQIVELFYLLAGIGIMSGSIYHLRK